MITKKLLWVGSAAAAVVLGITIALIVVSGGTNRDSGSATNAQPSQSGQASTTTTTASEDSSLASQLVRSKSVGFSTGQTDAAQDPSLTLNKVWVQPGDPLEIGATNLAPFSTVHLEIHSEVIDLGDVIADDSGSASTVVTIPASLANDQGIHMIVANGIDSSGQPFEITKQIRVGFDSEAPWLDPFGSPGRIAMSTNEIDTSAGSQTVTITLGIHDDLSGFDTGQFNWISEDGTIRPWAPLRNLGYCYPGALCSIRSGDDIDGTYAATVQFPGGGQQTKYTFMGLMLMDRVGNVRTYCDVQANIMGPCDVNLTTLGYTAGSFDITQTGAGDSTAPTIEPNGASGAMSISTNTIDTSSSAQNVMFSLGIQDPLSGFDSGSMSWHLVGSRGSIVACISKLMGSVGSEFFCKIDSGDEQNGSYSGAIHFPAYSPPGTYEFQGVTLRDKAGNYVSYVDPSHSAVADHQLDFTTLGYAPGSFDITQIGAGDLVGPWIDQFGSPGAISLSTNRIDTSNSLQSVAITLAVHDNLSGFKNGQFNWTNGDVSVSTCVFRGGSCDITSGDQLNGTYATAVRFAANSPAGVYKFTRLTMFDYAGNNVGYCDSSNTSCFGGEIDITTLGYAAGSLDIVNGP